MGEGAEKRPEEITDGANKTFRMKTELSYYKNVRMSERYGRYLTLKPLNGINLINMYRDYDVFFAHHLISERLGQIEDKLELRNVDEYHEDMGSCLWWEDWQIQNGLPIEDPAYIGSPLDTEWEDKYKYFVEIIALKK